MEQYATEVIHGDSLEVLPFLEPDSIDMVITSPIYAKRRQDTCGGISPEKYVGWFLPYVAEIKRVLKPTGSFFLNIKPHTVNGERSLYVFKLIIAIREAVGLNFIDELCWTKNAFPGAYKGRFKNGFEPVYHFAKSSPSLITFNPLACGTPITLESKARAYRKQCGAPLNGSGMAGVSQKSLRDMKVARPSNVIVVNNVSNQFSDKQKHPATYPEGLVEFFVKSFSNPGDVILDPFVGSGTTGVVCKKLNRGFIGIDNKLKYVSLSQKRIEAA